MKHSSVPPDYAIVLNTSKAGRGRRPKIVAGSPTPKVEMKFDLMCGVSAKKAALLFSKQMIWNWSLAVILDRSTGWTCVNGLDAIATSDNFRSFTNVSVAPGPKNIGEWVVTRTWCSLAKTRKASKRMCWALG